MKLFRKRWLTAMVVGLATLVSVPLAGPANASSMYFYRESGRSASVDWLEVGTLPAPVLGNAHLGSLYVEDLGKGKFNIFGWVEDYECVDGALPGGGHREAAKEEEDKDCVFVDYREIKAGDTSFSMDRKFTTATLTGTLTVVGGHDGEVLGSPPVDMTWTGIGSLTKSTEEYTYDDGVSSYSSKYSFSGRDADVEGRIGPMVFDDETDEYSYAQMGAFKNVERGRDR
jgi:hypothetical protein